mgnify:CR=1 FL=1
MKKNILGLLVVFLGTFAFAARTVQITIPKGQSVQISNPSTGTVNYDIECFDSSGTSKANLTGQSLSQNASKTYGETETCAGNALPANSSTVSTVGLLECAGSTNFANASALCDSFYSLCTFDQVVTSGPVSGNQYWFNINTATWLFSTNFGSTFNSASVGTGAASHPNSANSCKVGAVTLNFCQNISTSTSLAGALCCPASDVNICKVTVNTTSGFLSSPQFKGGAPF